MDCNNYSSITFKGNPFLPVETFDIKKCPVRSTVETKEVHYVLTQGHSCRSSLWQSYILPGTHIKLVEHPGKIKASCIPSDVLLFPLWGHLQTWLGRACFSVIYASNHRDFQKCEINIYHNYNGRIRVYIIIFKTPKNTWKCEIYIYIKIKLWPSIAICSLLISWNAGLYMHSAKRKEHCLQQVAIL